MKELDVRFAVRSGATLFLLGVTLLTIASFFRHDQRIPALAALATTGLAAVAVLLWLDRAGRATLTHVHVADIIGVAFVAALISQTGGVHSLYPPYYLFPVAYAAVFQARRRFVATAMLGLLAFLAPLAYDEWNTHFVTVALVALPLWAVLVTITNAAVEALRSERKRLSRREAEALRIADADGLTGIGNYRMFWRALESEASRARRYGELFSLIVLDLDGFKAINDEFGHQAGDEALRRVARALSAQLRAEDVLCRQGGDEFAVIAVHAAGAEARDLAGRLTDAVARDTARALPTALSATAGWATFGEPERTAQGLLSAADRVLRDFRRHGAAS